MKHLSPSQRQIICHTKVPSHWLFPWVFFLSLLFFGGENDVPQKQPRGRFFGPYRYARNNVISLIPYSMFVTYCVNSTLSNNVRLFKLCVIFCQHVSVFHYSITCIRKVNMKFPNILPRLFLWILVLLVNTHNNIA